MISIAERRVSALNWTVIAHYTESQKEYDRVRTTFLEMLEIKELRFTNNEVMENLEGVCEAIHAEVLKRRNDVHGSLFQKMKDKH